ncbi:MAG: beta-L-arabinofuranosidase domain-containing protein [Candidatus Acidiferrales bacterium]
MLKDLTRRQFVTTALSSAAISSLAGAAHASNVKPGQQSAASGAGQFPSGPWQDQGVLNLANSPYAKLHSVPVRAVTIESGFWAARRDANVTQSIPTMHDLEESHGRMDNFRRLVGKSNAPQIGAVYSDSDVYKWTEAVAFTLQSGDRPELRKTAEDVIDLVVSVQKPNGYLNTYFVGDRAALSMTPETQQSGHELYCLGHMLQGAIAYYRATGDRKWLDAGIRMVNDFLLPSFGPAPLQPIISGHPEIEMSLIELYRITGDKRHLELAGYILGGDDRIKVPRQANIYLFSGTPFIERTQIEGHAVRAMYACCGATDYYLETGDPNYWKTLNVLWNSMAGTKMYVTGGVGARAQGESFGAAYDLPNASAYAETCAAIGNMMWNWRLLAATGDAKFTDVLERALYNGVNSGMSLSGTLYCYTNPLAFDPSAGITIRNPWYNTICCPPNFERTMASLPGYFYSTSSDGIYVHLYDNSTLNWHLENGTALKVTQKTNMPWDGDVEITVTPAQASDFTFYLRIPAWAGDGTQVAVNGKPVSGVVGGSYLPIHRHWSAGDVIQARFPMKAQPLSASPHVAEDTGRVAVQRGPLVYCLEQLDQPTGVDLIDGSLAVSMEPGAEFTSEFKQDFLGGVIVLHRDGVVAESMSPQGSSNSQGGPAALYGPYRDQSDARHSHGVRLTFIPYYVWANREPSPMEVWAPVSKA